MRNSPALGVLLGCGVEREVALQSVRRMPETIGRANELHG